MSKSNDWRLPGSWPDSLADYVNGVTPKPAAQTHLWCEDGRTNRCGADPLGDHHTYRPDEVTCLACRALLAEDREDAKGSALVAAQRSLREAREQRAAVLLVDKELRGALVGMRATLMARDARIAELEKELNSVRELLKDAEQRTAVGRESNRELEKKLDFIQRLHGAQEARMLEAAKLAAAWMWDPDESPGEQFERVAEWFRAETGFLRPGKSEPFECARSPHERQAAWVAWSTEKNRAALAALRAAIAKADSEVKP